MNEGRYGLHGLGKVLAGHGLDHAVLGAAPFAPQGLEQLLNARFENVGHQFDVGRFFQQVDVQVAHVAGHGADDLQVPLKGRGGVGIQGALDLAQQGAGAAYSHPDVVQKFGVDVIANTRQVDLHGGRQADHDLLDRRRGRQIRRQGDVDFGRIPAGGHAALFETGHNRRCLHGRESYFVQHPGDLSGLVFIPPDRQQAAADDRPAVGVNAKPFDDQPGHGLLVDLADLDQNRVPGDRRKGQQGAHLQNRGENSGEIGGWKIPVKRPGRGGVHLGIGDDAAVA